MRFDLMVGATTWAAGAQLARDVEAQGFSGMLFTETSQTPWMSIAAAASAAPTLEFTTGIAVAFPRSPMVSAALAWELAENTGGIACVNTNDCRPMLQKIDNMTSDYYMIGYTPTVTYESGIPRTLR